MDESRTININQYLQLNKRAGCNNPRHKINAAIYRDLLIPETAFVRSTDRSGVYLSLCSLTLFVSNETRNVFSPAQNALNSSGVTSADRFILAPRR